MFDQLAPMLRPAGGGVHTVSTGLAQQRALQRQLYGAADDGEILPRWQQALNAAARARVVMLGIPSDAGAGIVRGAAHGPAGLREALLRTDPGFFMQPGLIDVGDVISVPQLLDDEMLSEAQRARTQAALYPDMDPAVRASMPVGPLDIAYRVVCALLRANANLRFMVLGGDHSVAWPITRALAEKWGEGGLAIVDFDAHTDLLEQRLGVRHCFATWAFHANRLLGGQGRMIQLGVRASGRDRAHWESTLGVRQIWANELAGRSPREVADLVIAHLQTLGIKQVYLSNDIDATDGGLAPATGTPEPDGLQPAVILAVIRALGQAFDVVAGDLVEVAPPVGDPAAAIRTCDIGAGYVRETVAAMLVRAGEGEGEE